MTLSLAGFLLVMALVDGTSIGTLVIPIWLVLVTRRGELGRVLAYLLTIAAFYLVLGLALAAGAYAVGPAIVDALDSVVGDVVVIAAGALLVWLSYRVDPKAKAKRGEDPESTARRWHERIAAALGTRRGIVVLALAAGAVEAASMLPYLAAIGALTAADLGAATTIATLVVYCLVMITPALVILALRIVAARWVDAPLRRFGTWAERGAGSATAWLLGIIGVLLILNGVGALVSR
ncbi:MULTISPECIES: GAP family protein [Mumia]|uniref:GAP family protein n=1 Tax=Mumia TaxID=1546255 RepID=UPI0014208EA6|nr:MULTISPECIES: GAP family protein [unclassified Mumia]QMW66331.1 GAP family protein [Mumia sp. ZJ1417]